VLNENFGEGGGGKMETGKRAGARTSRRGGQNLIERKENKTTSSKGGKNLGGGES